MLYVKKKKKEFHSQMCLASIAYYSLLQIHSAW